MVLRPRCIPVLLVKNGSLVKTVGFRNPRYVGDPVNSVRIFNEHEVDELMICDISASLLRSAPPLDLLSDLASECFMPLSYGGGLSSVREAKKVLEIGYEKVIVGTGALERQGLISEIAEQVGTQAVVVSIDVKTHWGRYVVLGRSGTLNTRRDPVDWAVTAESLGAGEIFLTSIDREGSWSGLDLSLVKQVVNAVSVPVVAHGGIGCWDNIDEAFDTTNVAAVGIGSFVVFQKQNMGVLVHYPSP